MAIVSMFLHIQPKSMQTPRHLQRYQPLLSSKLGHHLTPHLVHLNDRDTGAFRVHVCV